MRESFGMWLAELGATQPNMFVLDADVCTSTKSAYFREKYPDRFLQMGIAEQNMVGVAAGLSLAGCIPVVTAFGSFLSRRALDQIAVSIAYPRVKVIFCAGYSGLSSGKTGATHQAVEDIALMRALPNLVVVSPADDLEMRQTLSKAVEHDGPVYIRIHKTEVPKLWDEGYEFNIGKPHLLSDGSDIAVMSTGVMTHKAQVACNLLAKRGIGVRLVHMPTIKPLNGEVIAAAAKEIGKILTLEDHTVTGGFGGAVAELAAETGCCKVCRLGIEDVWCESGSEEDLYDKYGLSVNNIVKRIEDFLYDGESKERIVIW